MGDGTAHVTLSAVSAAPERRLAMHVARALGIPLADARSLVASAPLTLPKALPVEAADELAAALRAAGASAEVRPDAGVVAPAPCPAHAALEATEACSRCGTLVCAVCAAASGSATLCGACAGRVARSRAFSRVRIAALLVVLAAVLLYAYRDVARRRARNDWTRTLSVGLVLVRRGPVDDAAIEALRNRTHALEDRLAAELARTRGPGGPRPFEVRFYGPVDVSDPPPAPQGDGSLDLARYAYDEWAYVRRVDRAAGLESRGLDTRIYLVARPGHAGGRNFVEGRSEQGGRSGVVEVDLDPSMVDYALFVFAHELFHTLGATDKYDDAGDTRIPEGLVEPDASPRYPQRCADVMAHTRPVAPGREELPDRIDDLGVGPATAREIGWVAR